MLRRSALGIWSFEADVFELGFIVDRRFFRLVEVSVRRELTVF